MHIWSLRRFGFGKDDCHVGSFTTISGCWWCCCLVWHSALVMFRKNDCHVWSLVVVSFRSCCRLCLLLFLCLDHCQFSLLLLSDVCLAVIHSLIPEHGAFLDMLHTVQDSRRIHIASDNYLLIVLIRCHVFHTCSSAALDQNCGQSTKPWCLSSFMMSTNPDSFVLSCCTPFFPFCMERSQPLLL